MARTVIQAEPRATRGKEEMGRLRRGGRVPGVVYGANQPAIPVTLNPKQIDAVLHSDAGRNTILDLQLSGESASAMIADWQYEPLKGTLLHVDLKRIALDKVLSTSVPVQSAGEAPGVKIQGGILEFVSREVEVECLPMDIPESLVADVSNLGLNQNLRARDLKLPERVKLASDPELVIVHVIAPAALEEKAAETAEAAPAPAEPEVIKKGKAEKEEGEEKESKK